jgi:hypothetical protein
LQTRAAACWFRSHEHRQGPSPSTGGGGGSSVVTVVAAPVEALALVAGAALVGAGCAPPHETASGPVTKASERAKRR